MPNPVANPSEFWAEWVTKSEDANVTSAALLEEYKDAGYWGRHYSTVRLTLGTFFLTAAGGMLYHQWEKPDNLTAWGACGIALVGLALFAVFSYFTFKEMNRQLEISSVYRAKLGKAGKQCPLEVYRPLWTFTALPIGLSFFVLFCVLTVLWARGVFGELADKKPAPVEAKLPISVQVGSGNPVTIEVPVKVNPK
jgi:hypothetical protein